MIRPFRHISRFARLGTDLWVGTLAVLRVLAADSRFISNPQPGRSTGRASGRPVRRPEAMGLSSRGFGRAFGLFSSIVILLASLSTSAWAATPPGTPINNRAVLTYVVGSTVQPPASSNLVTFNVRSPAIIEFLTYAPTLPGAEPVPVPDTYYRNGGSFTLIPPPPETAIQPVPLTPAELYHGGNPFYLRLTELDQNSDPNTVQTILVTITSIETGDTEVLRLTESGPDTGIFIGYLPSTSSGSVTVDGVLFITAEDQVSATYTDAFDGTDTTIASALVDPYGYVFDSATGAAVDGVTVTLIDMVTGLPATTIVGDNGAPGYPASIVTGSTFDFGGLTYSNPTGGFRFPFVPPGDYRLVVTNTDNYAVPSSISDSELQTRSWWTTSGYVVGEGWANGQWTGEFTVNPGPAIRLDIPIDPLNSYLWLQKDVSRDVASTGDFLQYTLTLENGNALATAPGVTISDQLPLGFRYQKGSTRIAGRKQADPAITPDGRTLTFTLGDVSAASSIEISYVVEVAAGAKVGKAVNLAQAIDSNKISSNIARETVEVRDMFFRNTAVLVGRVLEGACTEEDSAMLGVPGVRVYLEDGSYVVTDKDGKYHFEGITPGQHVVQVDTLTIPVGYEMTPCEQSSQFAGRTFSQFVDLKGGTLWRVNFYTAPTPPPVGTAGLTLEASLDGQQADFNVGLSATAVPVNNLRTTIMLPAGASYLTGTATRDGQTIDDPQAFGETVTFRFPGLEADQRSVITFKADVTGVTTQGELPTKALLTFDTPSAKNQRTPLAEVRFAGISEELTSSEEIRLFPRFPSFVAALQETDLAMLEQLAGQLKTKRIARIDLVGHADSQEIAPRSQKLFSDNLALSVGRARNVVDFLKSRLDIPAEAISVRGMGDTMPMADNTTEAGRAQNRRVELFVVSEKVDRKEALVLTQPSSPEQTVTTAGLTVEGVPAPVQKTLPPPAAKPPKLDQELLSTVPRERSIVWPAEGFVPEIPNIEVMVQFQRGEQVSLRLNDEPVPTLNFDESKQVPNSAMMISSWAGVDLRDGLNRLEAVMTDAGGKEVARLQRDIWYVTMAENLEYFPEQSTLIADGLKAPTFAIRLTDKDGHPLHPKQQVQFRVSPPYLALQNNGDRTLNPAEAQGTFEIGADGLAYLQLQPTAQAGEVTVAVMLPDGPQEITAWLNPAPREWILVGFAEGTVGHNTIKDNKVSAAAAGIDDDSYSDGQVKFFAKGAIKGDWLLTLAYDSDKPDLDGDSLHQIIDPDTYYPLYGDETQQGYEASSAEKLYVKLERDQFYALFGDMQTGLNQTVLSQYSRNMNGFKSELQGERFTYTVFAAETKQSFKKDEIRGEGTAGCYALSQSELVINSEEVVIETRDRFHNELIVSEERLSRHIDYDIDYDAGTLYFKRPVPSKDQNFNPIFIVVRYETNASSGTNQNYGGRAAVKLLDQQVEIGGSLIHEENGAEKGDLYGTDVTVKLTPQTTLRVEAATSEVNSMDDDDQKGDAYLAEIEHLGKDFGLRTWFRQQDTEFGLGQQNGGTEGMRTYGAEGTYHFNQKWSLLGEAYHEDNLDSDATRDVESLQALYQAERYGLSTGMREARDKFEDGEKQTSRQLLAGANWSTPNRKLTLRTTHEQSLGSNNKNSDYPTRTMLGADYQLTRNVSLFAEQEFTWGEQENTEGTRVGLKATPWKGGEVRTAVERQNVENAERVFALFGVGQIWQVTQKWSVDLSVDRSYTVKNQPTGERVNDNVPPASGGNNDFTAVSLGAAYRTEKWSWWNRLETRQGDSEDRVGVSTGVVGDVREGVAVSARLMAFINNSKDGSDSDEEEITLALAYRPNRSRWILLERLDFSLYNEEDNGADSDSMRIVNHMHANFRTANRKWQTSFYYGLKYVRENFDGDRYDGYTDMISIETRYNINSKWDIGAHGALLHSWNSNQVDYSLGGDVGYLVMTNAWVSLGYNLVGFEDQDFSDANYTAEGAYVRFRAKLDQQSVREAAEWMNK